MSSSSSSSVRPKRKYTDDDDNDVEESDPQLSDEDDFEERRRARLSPFYPANVSNERSRALGMPGYENKPAVSWLIEQLFGREQPMYVADLPVSLYDRWQEYRSAPTKAIRDQLRASVDPVQLSFPYEEHVRDRISRTTTITAKVGYTTIPRALLDLAKSRNTGDGYTVVTTMPYTEGLPEDLRKWTFFHIAQIPRGRNRMIRLQKTNDKYVFTVVGTNNRLSIEQRQYVLTFS